MWGRLVIILAVLAAIAGGLLVVGDSERMAALRARLGLGIETGVPRLEPAEIEAELTRLSALPVPGVEAGEDAEVPPLGRLAEAAVRCVNATGAVVRARKAQAVEGLGRYLLVFGALGAAPETPLLEPRFRTLQPLFAKGPRALQTAAAEAELTADERATLADFHATYSQIAHPLYEGLQLYDRSFPALDFKALLQALAERRGAVADCALAEVLPPPEAEDAVGPQAPKAE